MLSNVLIGWKYSMIVDTIDVDNEPFPIDLFCFHSVLAFTFCKLGITRMTTRARQRDGILPCGFLGQTINGETFLTSESVKMNEEFPGCVEGAISTWKRNRSKLKGVPRRKLVHSRSNSG